MSLHFLRYSRSGKCSKNQKKTENGTKVCGVDLRIRTRFDREMVHVKNRRARVNRQLEEARERGSHGSRVFNIFPKRLTGCIPFERANVLAPAEYKQEDHGEAERSCPASDDQAPLGFVCTHERLRLVSLNICIHMNLYTEADMASRDRGSYVVKRVFV